MPLQLPGPYQGEMESPHGDFTYLYVLEYSGAAQKFYLTQHSGVITVANLPSHLGPSPQQFTPAQIRHGTRRASEEYEGQSFEVQVGVYQDRVPRDFYLATPRHIRVHVIKTAQGVLQDAQPAIDYLQHCHTTLSGIAIQVGLSGQTAMMTLAPEPFSWNRRIPRYWFQRLCNHRLYDSATCKVSSAAFSWATTVSSLDRIGRRVTLTGQRAGWPSGTFQWGWLSHSPSGEDSFIEKSEHVGPNTRVTLRTWNPELAAASAVTLFAGCNRTTADCSLKFANLENFGGYPQLPKKDPVVDGV